MARLPRPYGRRAAGTAARDAWTSHDRSAILVLTQVKYYKEDKCRILQQLRVDCRASASVSLESILHTEELYLIRKMHKLGIEARRSYRFRAVPQRKRDCEPEQTEAANF